MQYGQIIWCIGQSEKKINYKSGHANMKKKKEKKTSKGKIQKNIERNCSTSSSKHSYDGKS
jgi:hypothetical protein